MGKMDGVDKPLNEQILILKNIIFQNKRLSEILSILQGSNLQNYYVSSGCINQTIFNYYHGYDLNKGIEDIDIIYYDKDISIEKEEKTRQYLNSLFINMDISFDIINEARTHLWFKKDYGYNIEPYQSVEEAISTFGATVSCIGVRLEKGEFIVYAPYGLNDLFKMVIRPTKNIFGKEKYEQKAMKWKKKWSKLTIISWDI